MEITCRQWQTHTSVYTYTHIIHVQKTTIRADWPEREREKEKEWKKWCGVMIRWTPGARHLVSLAWARSRGLVTQCGSICPPLDALMTHTHTHSL